MPVPDDLSSDVFRTHDARAREDPENVSSPEWVKAQVSWRERQFSTATVVQFATIAGQAGINITDLLCIGILDAWGPVTPGHLATLTGLSTGSVTTLVDRMERAGLVRRVRDEEDRRRIFLHLNHQELSALESPYQMLNEAYWRFLDRFPVDELKVIMRYLDEMLPFMNELTAALRTHRAEEPAP